MMVASPEGFRSWNPIKSRSRPVGTGRFLLHIPGTSYLAAVASLWRALVIGIDTQQD
jgi:hypothetical protein